MGENSAIEWTDHTFNPWIGCTKVSPGCANCYAEARSRRFPAQGQWGPGAPRVRTSAANWRKPLAWDRRAERAAASCRCEGGGVLVPEACSEDACSHHGVCPSWPCQCRIRPRVFCASLADWLDAEAPAEWLRDLLALIFATPHLDWLLLTKRPRIWRERMMTVAVGAWRTGGYDVDDKDDQCEAAGRNLAAMWLDGEAPVNVWLGTTVEDQRRADERIPALLEIPARVRFLSCEPLLERVDLWKHMHIAECFNGRCPGERCSVDWVICGGESGPGARPMHPDWAREMRDQCEEAGVAFMFKQWGDWAPSGQADWQHHVAEKAGQIARFTISASTRRAEVGRQRVFAVGQEAAQTEEMLCVGKKAAGRMLDGRTWDEVPS